jgi:hypothetical protein
MKIPNTVLQFAMTEKNLEPYKMFYDYFQHYTATQTDKKKDYQTMSPDGKMISFAEKEAQMNAALKREIIRVSGVQNFGEFAVEQYVTNPMVTWATFAVINAMIDMILPESIIDSIGLYSDIRNIGWGDTALFEVEPRDLFVVSKHGKSQRSTDVHKQFKAATIPATPEFRELTVQVSLYKVLIGLESLAAFVTKVVRSLETQLTFDVYDAFQALMVALPQTTTTGLYVSGYSQAVLVRLAQQVTAWNQGAKAVIVGTQAALVNVLPDDSNFRYTLDSEYVRIGYIPRAFGYDVMVLPQIADPASPWALKLSNDYIYILSPSSQKLIKVVLEGTTLANTTGTFDHANLTQNATITKSWGVGVATNATAGIIAL